MDKAALETLVDELLIEINDYIEGTGNMIEGVFFDFSRDGEDTVEFLKSQQIEYQELEQALNLCLARGYLKRRTMGGEKHVNFSLTEEGQGRAISADAAKRNAGPSYQNKGDIHIGTLNARGATQIGHNNVQNIESLIGELVKEIDNANATDEDKQEAKSLLKAFLAHPLTSAAIGAGTATLIAMCGG